MKKMRVYDSAGAQEEIMRFVRDFWAKNSSSPTFQDIVNKTGISSKSLVHYHLNILEERGELKRRDGRSRYIIPTNIKITFED